MHKVVKINTNTEVLVLQQLEKEIVSLELKIKLMQQLTTASGFFSFYFDKLKKHLSCEDCFLYVNDLYFQLFGKHRYSSFETFKTCIHGNA